MSNLREIFVDITAGSIGGCAGIITGQPGDTIKVRLQTHGKYYTGVLDCIKQTVKNEGIQGLYKGMSSPLIGNAFSNAIVFAGYGGAMRVLDSYSNLSPMTSVYFAGSFAGLVQSLAICPAELDGHANTNYKGPFDCAKQIYKAKGIPGLYLGLNATIWREAPSFGLYFYAYDYIKDHYRDANGESSLMTKIFAGGCAGVLSWLVCYPVDVVKSLIQTLPDDAPRHERSMLFQAKKLYMRRGIHAFTAGLGVTLIRAFPVNAVTLTVFEYTLQVLGSTMQESR